MGLFKKINGNWLITADQTGLRNITERVLRKHSSFL